MRLHIIVSTLAIAGCASDIMQSYVGRDISAVVANYGEPYRRFDLPDGRIAYQWRLTEVSSRPTEIQYVLDQDGGRVTGRITSSEGYVTTEICFYTFYAKPIEHSAQITGFEKPTFDCE